MVLDGLLLKIIELEGQKSLTVLCIPTSKKHILLDYYHSSIMGGHSCITKCFKTISQRFYCPNLAEQLRVYITGYHTFQIFKKGKCFDRPHQNSINLNVQAMTKLAWTSRKCHLIMVIVKYWCCSVTFLISLLHYLYTLPKPSMWWKYFREATLLILALHHTFFVIWMHPSHLP